MEKYKFENIICKLMSICFFFISVLSFFAMFQFNDIVLGVFALVCIPLGWLMWTFNLGDR